MTTEGYDRRMKTQAEPTEWDVQPESTSD